jgi:hypothetical protein
MDKAFCFIHTPTLVSNSQRRCSMKIFKKFSSLLAGLATAAVLVLGSAAPASATCVSGCTTPPPSLSDMGVTVFGGIQSATAGQAFGDGAGSTVNTETYSIGEELFTVGADVNYKVDAAPGCTGCGDQVANVFLTGYQTVGGGALNKATNAGPAFSSTQTGTASAFKGVVGVQWGAVAPQ